MPDSETSIPPRPPSSFDDHEKFYEDSIFRSIMNRFRKEPLVPIGFGLTTWALLSANKALKAGNAANAQEMFRRRIYAQLFTLFAMGAGTLYWQKDKFRRREWQKAKAEREAKEKHEAWIRELEFRDQENRDNEARMKREREQRRQERFEQQEREVQEEMERLQAVQQQMEAETGQQQSVTEAAKELMNRR